MDQIDDAPVPYIQRDQAGDQDDQVDGGADKLREAVLASASEARRAFFMFGAFSLYLIITVGTTTHEQLLRGSTFQLPILNVAIPLIGFYLVVPTLFFLAHLNLLGELNALAENVDKLKRRLKQRRSKSDLPFPFGISRVFIQPPEMQAPRQFIVFVVIMSAIVLPPFVLLAVQVRLLSYHSEGITWLHRALVAADIVALWLLWPRAEKILRRGWRFSHLLAWLRSIFRYRALALLATVTMFVISLLVVTIPDEWIERQVISLSQQSAAIEPGIADDTDWPTETNCTFAPWHALNVVSISRTYRGGSEMRRAMPCWTYLMLEGPHSVVSLRRNLIVSNKDLVAIRPMPELLRDQRGEFLKAVWDDVGEGLDLRGRDLRFADLAYSDLRKADFRGADLSGARLMHARLDYAQFRDIPKADLGTCTSGLEDASVKTCRTNLRKADLQSAKVNFTSLFKADLQGANLYWAELFNSDLNHANLANITWLHTSIEETDVPFPYHCSVKRLGASYIQPPSHCGCSQPPPLSMRGLPSVCSKRKALSVFPG